LGDPGFNIMRKKLTSQEKEPKGKTREEPDSFASAANKRKGLMRKPSERGEGALSSAGRNGIQRKKSQKEVSLLADAPGTFDPREKKNASEH